MQARRDHELVDCRGAVVVVLIVRKQLFVRKRTFTKPIDSEQALPNSRTAAREDACLSTKRKKSATANARYHGSRQQIVVHVQDHGREVVVEACDSLVDER